MDDLRLPHTHNDYTIGWVCALPNEQTAAIFMLDERHEDLPNPSGDQNTYILGSIGKHNVVIAGLPLGRVGNNTAATVATRMVSSFPNVRVGLMVGVGGGIPQKTRLGDVVISCPNGTEPGVIQWDMGKTEAGGQFIRTGSLAPPPTALLTALTRFKADHITTRTNMLAYLKNLESIPNMPKSFLKSDSLQDVLYDSSYGHMEEATLVLMTKMKTIVACNQVIKDANLRDTLSQQFNNNLLCIEMEAAGLMNDFPCVVIRGISDYSDSHKSKKWQDYAAATAAACAKALLMVVATSEVDKLQRVQLTISPGIIQSAMNLWPFWRNEKKDTVSPIVINSENTKIKNDPQPPQTSPAETVKPGGTGHDAKLEETVPEEKPGKTIPTEVPKQTNSDDTSSTQPNLEAWLQGAPPSLRTMLQQGNIEAVVRIICMGLSQLPVHQEGENLPQGYTPSGSSECGGYDRDLGARSGSYAEMPPLERINSMPTQASTTFPEENKVHASERNHDYGNKRRHLNSVPLPTQTPQPFDRSLESRVVSRVKQIIMMAMLHQHPKTYQDLSHIVLELHHPSKKGTRISFLNRIMGNSVLRQPTQACIYLRNIQAIDTTPLATHRLLNPQCLLKVLAKVAP
ncbi:hypothetical protein TrVFT333_010556 [Trichoderma virens FT-333]|nr:hypothetical protein TrVFT333_010556 [Trichoderma virens FT-333]